MKSTAILIFESSAQLGGGHRSRCLALAQAMRPSWDITLATNESAGASHPLPHDRIVEFPDGRPEALLARLGHGEMFDLGIIDHYKLDRRFASALRTFCREIAVIDDLADRPHDADTLIDPAPGGSRARYRGLVPADCRLLLGCAYAILRPEFRQHRSNRADILTTDRNCRLLVSLGATDPSNATARVLDELQAVSHAIEVTAILSSRAPHLDSIKSMIPGLSYRARLIVDAADMAGLYAEHDLAIGAPATSAFERAATGLPSLLVVTADNQRVLARDLFDLDAAELLGEASGLQPGAIAAAVDRALSAPHRLETMSRCGRRLVDGWGAPRVAAHLARSFRDSKGGKLTARPVKPEDACEIHRWQTAPGSRAYSRNPNPPTWEEHLAWMSGRLTNTDALTEVILAQETPSGLVRLDRCGSEWEISILVAPDARGQGIASAGVRYMDALVPDEPITAWIHPANIASRRLFEGAGYGDRAMRHIRWLDR